MTSRRKMRWPAVPENSRSVDPARLNPTPEAALASSRDADRRRLVRRGQVYSIIAAWIVTLPISAGLGAIIFRLLSLVG